MLAMKNKVAVALLAGLAALSLAEEDSKWVWKSSRRADRDELERSPGVVGKPRYEVYDDEGPSRPGGFRPPYDFARPGRPTGIHHEPGFPGGAFSNRPGSGPLFAPNERPGGGGGFGNYRPGRPGTFEGYRPGGGNYRPGGEQAILTGPVPSWEREPPIKNFDSCKCAEKFNCNSPGIAYGQCDVGKQYCCFHNNKDRPQGGPIPSRPVHSPENGVLVGPGGPVDYPNRPYPNQRPSYPNDHNGVLVGPGGPAGISGRPPKRPYYDGDYDVLSGPGGQYGGGFGYGPRSTKDAIK